MAFCSKIFLALRRMDGVGDGSVIKIYLTVLYSTVPVPSYRVTSFFSLKHTGLLVP